MGDVITSCTDLGIGEWVTAGLRGCRVRFAGRVTGLFPALDLFWVLGEDGLRRAVDFSRFEVHRAAAP
ncbi:hypothetical protein [Sinomonas sp. ASV322]|uniref:hypothetical protein n=1 Tax=Sinomonas sp. ASV322 TaxID=3041920 RepID=UPI0027DE47DE|nr:hypothetical protein [Sinomonas sp. ASV322]MDQ4503708.1 hypothetical protein [Sinomonas sp. ASV322]